MSGLLTSTRTILQSRPSSENVGVSSSPVTGSVTGNCLWSLARIAVVLICCLAFVNG
jgi:hypothetical protein